MNLRRILIAGTIGVGGVLALASAAWACANVLTPAYVVTQDPVTHASLTSSPANVPVVVAGANFDPGRVVVLWGLNSSSAVQVGAATVGQDGTFATTVLVPDVGARSQLNYFWGVPDPLLPGDHFNPAVFEVVVPGSPAPIPLPRPNVTTGSANAGDLFPDQPVTDPGAKVQPVTPTNPGGTVGASLPGTVTSPSRAAAGSVAVPGLTGAVDVPGTATANAPPQGVVADPSSAQGTASAALAVPPADNPALPSVRSGADLWSGFTKGAGPTQAPSLLDAPSSGHTPGLALGMGLAFGATVALCMGFGLAEVRRRRALA